MRIAIIDENICDRSPFCPAAMSCRIKAFKVSIGGPYRFNISIDEDKCTGCGVCTKYCAPNAIKIVDKEKVS